MFAVPTRTIRDEIVKTVSPANGLKWMVDTYAQLTIIVHHFVLLAANMDATELVIETAGLFGVVVITSKRTFESGVAVAGQLYLLPRFKVEFLNVVLRHVRGAECAQKGGTVFAAISFRRRSTTAADGIPEEVQFQTATIARQTRSIVRYPRAS